MNLYKDYIDIYINTEIIYIYTQKLHIRGHFPYQVVACRWLHPGES